MTESIEKLTMEKISGLKEWSNLTLMWPHLPISEEFLHHVVVFHLDLLKLVSTDDEDTSLWKRQTMTLKWPLTLTLLTLTYVTFDLDLHDHWPWPPLLEKCAKCPKITFLDLVTLTFDPWPWSSRPPQRASTYIPTPNFMTLATILGEIWIIVQSILVK